MTECTDRELLELAGELGLIYHPEEHPNAAD